MKYKLLITKKHATTHNSYDGGYYTGKTVVDRVDMSTTTVEFDTKQEAIDAEKAIFEKEKNWDWQWYNQTDVQRLWTDKG